jgi:membrane protease subunit HflK
MKNLSFESPWEKKSKNNTVHDFFQKLNKNNFSNNNFNAPKLNGGGVVKTLCYAILGLVILWLLSGFYKVQEGEEAAVTRFGKFVRKGFPGLNYRIPDPIEDVQIEKVNQSRRIEIGYRSSGGRSDSSTRGIANESTMLTSDENIVELNCDVMWHIKDMESYIFNVAAPEETVKTATESAIREVIGQSTIASILSSQRQEIADRIEKLTQNILDQYVAGIQVEKVQLLKAEPPSEVIDAYRDVQTSKADKEREINQALTYNNDVIPNARGRSAKMIQEAEGYKQEIVAQAEGDTKRFNAIYVQYQVQKQLTRDRLYLEALEQVLSGSTKYIVGADMLPHMQIGKSIDKQSDKK